MIAVTGATGYLGRLVYRKLGNFLGPGFSCCTLKTGLPYSVSHGGAFSLSFASRAGVNSLFSV